ncbi:DUF2497 domain-containing protein [Xanthobacter autotrophicus]|uniref:DUF2497 domain-containing protein n=1 Tax=Xanthobacter autotrophicus TaxID=280 RepID=UPI0024A6282A|nr:DUF2497 domain-containing protein [Xanthobacter autotrophicus]
MEDILASIRRIMADDDVPPAAARSAPDRAARPAPAERRRPDAPEPGSDAAERPARRGEPRIQDPHDAGHREGPARPAAGDGQMRARARIDLEELSEHLTSETQAGELPESDPHDIPQSASGHPFHGPAMNGQMPQEPPGRERGRAPEAAPRVVREFERRGAGPSEPERFEASPPLRAARPAERPAPEFRPGPRGEARAPQVARRATPPVAEEPAGMDAQPETDDRGDAVRRRDLLSPNVDDVVAAAFQSLGDLLLPQKQRTIEDLVKEILRPMLKDWLDQNLPTIVERLVRAEIERVARRPR